MQTRSITCPQPRPEASLRLLCAPHAGSGAASFYPLAGLLAPHIELLAVQLPGREARLSEPPHRAMTPLIMELADAFEQTVRSPYALFGHSMGALVVFELARELRRRGLPPPRQLICSGRRAPTIPNDGPPLHAMPDAAFVDELVRRYDAIPRAILDEPELMALFMPVLKADFAVFESHVHQHERPLDCDIALYGGRDDPQTPEMDGWASLAAGQCTRRLFDGGHFYLAAQRRLLADALRQDLLQSAPVG